jgi:hypothetical protein
VIRTRRVAESVWLAVYCPPLGRRLIGRDRRRADCDAARRAWDAAVAAADIPLHNARGSRAHTEAWGAALVGPRETGLGVDLVAPERFALRHAREILDPDEWGALPLNYPDRPALAWGLKEAAAKAFGEPGRRFPAGLRIVRGTLGVEVVAKQEARSSLLGRWERIGPLLCVWVLEIS